jgi:hypothetical protein
MLCLVYISGHVLVLVSEDRDQLYRLHHIKQVSLPKDIVRSVSEIYFKYKKNTEMDNVQKVNN